MATRTTHVFPKDGDWAVRKEGSAKHAVDVDSTQRLAVEAARAKVRRSTAGQLVIHRRNGTIHTEESHGLPIVQAPPCKSSLGRKAIERAVSSVILKRLAAE